MTLGCPIVGLICVPGNWHLDPCTRYYTRTDAENAMRFVNGTRLDDRIIRTDWDAGFKEGRQYGRGKSGGQVNLHRGNACLLPQRRQQLYIS